MGNSSEEIKRAVGEIKNVSGVTSDVRLSLADDLNVLAQFGAGSQLRVVEDKSMMGWSIGAGDAARVALRPLDVLTTGVGVLLAQI